MIKTNLFEIFTANKQKFKEKIKVLKSVIHKIIYKLTLKIAQSINFNIINHQKIMKIL